MTNLVVTGIDYSMSSPSICVHVGKTWCLTNCKFYFLTSKKKHIFNSTAFCGEMHKDYSSQEERFDNISEWAVNVIPRDAKVFMEGYSYASSGVVFDIAENTGLLKHKLWTFAQEIVLFSPPSIKKFASGKGNSNKIAMFDAFLKETCFDLQKTFSCNIGDSPMSDIIDSYYVAKLGFNTLSGINSKSITAKE